MIRHTRHLIAFLALTAAPAWAQFGFDSGSDGRDGPLNLAILSAMDTDPTICPPTCDATTPCTCEIDLSRASDGTWDTAAGTPDGIYDAAQWAVVFRYSTIDIPPGVTVVFKNHPKNPPVVWLAEEDVTIDGTVNLDGKPGVAHNGSAFAYAEPGPGGFAGGLRPSGVGNGSGGFGPGGGHIGLTANNRGGGGGGYGGSGAAGAGGGLGGSTYGNGQILLLVGGSGGGSGPRANKGGAGGAGGGAILIATSTTMNLNGLIQAKGGSGGSGNENCVFTGQTGCGAGGSGSGGAIRLIANSASGVGTLNATGGISDGTGGGNGGGGRLRVEVAESTLPFGFVAVMGPVFPLDGLAATLTILSIDGETVTEDPDSGIVTVETMFGNAASVPVVIQATNVPDGILINVILTPARGDINTAAQEEPATVTGGMATAMVIFPAGRNEIQIRANW